MKTITDKEPTGIIIRRRVHRGVNPNHVEINLGSITTVGIRYDVGDLVEIELHINKIEEGEIR